MYAITQHRPRTMLFAPGLKTLENRSSPAPDRLVG